MSDAHVPETQPTASDEHQTTPAEIEQTLEQIGARYIADLRTLSEKFGQFYGELLATKDAQIAECAEHVEALDRELSEARAVLATKDEQIAHLKQRAEDAERDGAARAAQVRQFEEISARYLAEFQRLNTELGLSTGSPSDQPQASRQPLAAAKRTIVLDAEQAKPATTRTVRRFVGAHYHVEKLLRFAARNNLTKAAMGEG
jgi:chromosome segregation ATPase